MAQQAAKPDKKEIDLLGPSSAAFQTQLGGGKLTETKPEKTDGISNVKIILSEHDGVVLNLHTKERRENS